MRTLALRQIISAANGRNTENGWRFVNVWRLSETTFNCYAKNKAKFCAKIENVRQIESVVLKTLQAVLPPMLLEDWAEEQYAFHSAAAAADDETFPDVKLKVEDENVPVRFLF